MKLAWRAAARGFRLLLLHMQHGRRGRRLALAAAPERGQQLIRLGRHVSFLNKAGLLVRLNRVVPNTTLVLEGTRSAFIDPDVLSTIEHFRARVRQAAIEVLLLRKAEDYAQYLATRPLDSRQDEDFLAYYQLFAEARNWVAEKLRRQLRLADVASQQPRFLFIGYAEQPAAAGLGVAPAKVFGGRPVPNLLVSTDLELPAVVKYAVEVLQIQHIVVCGHYGSPPATVQPPQAAPGPARRQRSGPPARSRSQIAEPVEQETEQERRERLVQLNVVEQLYGLQQMACVQTARTGAAPVQLHGWVLDPAQGLLHDLAVDLRRDFSEYDTLFRYQVGPGGLCRLPGELSQTPFLYALSAGTATGPVLAMPPLDTPSPLDEL